MMNNNFFRRRRNKPRQEWNPHWTLKLLYGIWSAAMGLVKIALGALATVVLICLICVFVFVGILGDYLQSDILPEAAIDLSDYELDQTSFIYYVDSDGNIQQLQQIYTDIDREWAYIDDIPEDLIHAAVAIEDKRFYEHQGVDWITTVKACTNLFFGGDSKFGGSTITQQLIKNLTKEDSVTVQRKVMEIFKAQQCEKNYEKDFIMELYLNTIYLGRGCYGVRSAAEEYFGKELENLTTAECASLISITNNPSIYNPYRAPFSEGGKSGAERNRERQLSVLDEMLSQEWLTQEEYDAAVAQEMVFKEGIAEADRMAECTSCGYSGTVSTFTGENGKYYCPTCGSAVSVHQDESQKVYSWFVEVVMEDVAKELAAQNGIDWNSADKATKENYMMMIQRGGYHIYSTLDMEVQNAIDRIYTDLTQIPTTRSTQQLQSGIVVIDNRTGDIVGLSGGVGEKTSFDAWSCATDAKLQTGSSQKPLSVYAPAFESGAVSPATVITDLPVYYSGGTGFPRNDNRSYSYSRTVFGGIVNSVNGIAAHTLDKIGFDYSYNFAKEKFGQSTLTDSYETSSGKVMSDLDYSPLALGALTVGSTVRDMSAAYATFANDGVYREARTYTKVYNSNGDLILDNTQDSRQILSEKTVDYMNYCLTFAVSSGTGGAASISGQYVAGKTGTTSSNRDRWFCGYTEYYTAAVWCGYNQPEVIRLTGNTSNPSARLWKKVMEPLHSGKSAVRLYDTSGMRSYSVCLDSGKLATSACENAVRKYTSGLNRVASAYAYSGDGPSATCDQHVMVDYCKTGNGVATEYCSKFPDVEIVERALVKMGQNEIDEMKKAGSSGLSSAYLDDNAIYFTGSGAWHGFSGNVDNNEPYLTCKVHTKQAWEDYEAAQATEPPTEAPEVTDPAAPTDPAA